MASLRMMEQYAVILTRYPVYQPYTDADEWTLNFYESRLKFESKLLGRMYALKQDNGVEYFGRDDVKSVRPARKKTAVVKIGGIQLCTHHATGKKSSFVDCIKFCSSELLAVAKAMLDLDHVAFCEWVYAHLNKHYRKILSLKTEIEGTAAAILAILGGQGPDLPGCDGVASKTCQACQVCSILSSDAYIESLYFLANYSDRKVLKLLLIVCMKQFSKFYSRITPELADATYSKVKVAMTLYESNTENALAAYEEATAPTTATAPIQSANVRHTLKLGTSQDKGKTVVAAG